jgi:hypothetical protein
VFSVKINNFVKNLKEPLGNAPGALLFYGFVFLFYKMRKIFLLNE